MMEDMEKKLALLLASSPHFMLKGGSSTYGKAAKDFIANGVVVREKGEWILEANQERANYRWNVTAECPICHAEKKEIYAGFFPGFPKDLAEQTILDSAKSIKLSDFCPNCGADMRRGENG